ncbi:dsRNA-specific ribonuclease III [Mycoplasmopsis californica]|uniref:Ribonuclease 3 n=1 Tax=Mycoplasmopsis equigenitalium TaxID=114883 RepID=A0ABY5J5A5_9BACT|nr:ribonuclease III domain-containing protein [Mycoplasmopsis equigenitalium]UUD36878.1 putative dsRNA-binding protein [Mycoplasmopsis equigenitalium]VEU69827.1 dsRNA-specific ribonuclease III [Mycoplasmopsis californica]
MNLTNKKEHQAYLSKLKALLETYQVPYNNLELYITAFTHGSYNNQQHKQKTYELLEFLGDSLIGSYAAKHIYYELNEKDINDPGIATKIKSEVVKNAALGKITVETGLVDLIIHSLKNLDDKEQNKIKGDIFESLCGCIYVDTSLNDLNNFLNIILKPKLVAQLKKIDKMAEHPKSIFQELIQKHKLGEIVYETKEFVEDNHLMFISKLMVNGMVFGEGVGTSKQNAETDAAEKGLKKYQEVRNETN